MTTKEKLLEQLKTIKRGQYKLYSSTSKINAAARAAYYATSDEIKTLEREIQAEKGSEAT